MRHKKGIRKLSRPTDQRLALLVSLVGELFKHGRIKTTHMRAKQAAKIADHIVTLAKDGRLHSIRQISKILRNRSMVKEIVSMAKEKYSERPGGYTRTIKIGRRRGDNATVSLLELV